MNKHKGKSFQPARRSTRQEPPSGFYTPFQELDQLFGLNFSTPKAPLDASSEKPEFYIDKIKGETDDGLLFRNAMADVTPLCARPSAMVPLRSSRKAPRFLAEEENKAYAQLVDLVAGEGPFELYNSDEYIDGAILGISPDILKKLREGYFSPQGHLDLHGLNRLEAREEVREFLMDSFAARRRCVLIIAGRGLNSKDREPVLKKSLVSWLMRAPLKRVVLAFACALPCDGGWGAFYVLLRKNADKGPLITPAE
ncbi:MAG: Smr/MutS family protein [Syntrophobacteraceae bacterium]